MDVYYSIAHTADVAA